MGGREGGRASKQQKIFQKLMPWTLPTFLVLEEPTHFSAVHKQHPAMRSSPGARPGQRQLYPRERISLLKLLPKRRRTG